MRSYLRKMAERAQDGVAAEWHLKGMLQELPSQHHQRSASPEEVFGDITHLGIVRSTSCKVSWTSCLELLATTRECRGGR